MSFLDELKRRNVVRLGIAYAVSAWVLLQILDVIGEILELPAWGGKVILFVLIAGFFVTLFVAWAFELTPHGIKRESEVDRSQSDIAQTGRKLDRLIILALALAVAYLAVDKFLLDPARDEARHTPATQTEVVTTPQDSPEPPTGVTTEEPTIAVLPFVNISDDEDYFADGLSEELINMLAKLPGLKVTGRTSSFMFKGRNEDLREIGQALGVKSVLEGSVRRSGERLRITAQLVNVGDGFHVWSETYDRQLVDIFDIQDDVAQAISEALEVHLLAPDQRPTNSVEAYALYLEATSIMQNRDWSRALDFIDAAIALDPDYAKAWELKAAFYFGGGASGIVSSETQRLCNEAANRALALDPELPEARFYAASSDEDFSLLREFDALLQLVQVQPNNQFGIRSLLWDMTYLGYFERALDLADRTIAMDPFLATARFERGKSLMALGRPDEAYEAWQQSYDRGDSVAASLLGWAELIAGNDETAVIWFQRAWELSGAAPWDVQSFIDNARHPVAGKAFLDQKLADLPELPTGIHSGGRGGLWYLAFGYLEEFWQWLEVHGIHSKGWSEAMIPLSGGMIFNKTGFTALPEYQLWANERLAPVWEEHGAPDHCRNSQDRWICE